jgi:hypothetical protein
MPDELNNTLNASTIHTSSRRLLLDGSSTVSVMVWTMSGIVLASCGGGGGGGGPSVTAPSFARVVDGPVINAAVYFDVTGGPGGTADGKITQADRVHRDNVDANGAALYRTNARGEVEVPAEFASRLFVADVNGAIDTATNARLTGEFMSLARGGIATPLTDLINREGGESQAQRVLNQIFDPGRVSLQDVLNIDNYRIQANPQQNSTAHLVTEAALILTEIDKNKATRSSLPSQNETTERIELLRKVIADNTSDADAKFITEMVTVRVAAGHETRQGTRTDVNDNKPEIDISGQQVILNEGTITAGTDTGYRISASDLDDPHGKPNLGVSDNNFWIDDDGKLLFAQNVTVDFETPTERNITLTIIAEDTGKGGQGAPGNGTERVIIHFSNRNDNSPVIMQTDLTQETLIQGPIAAGTDTGYSFSASDPDDPDGKPVLTVSDDRFLIDEQGKLRFARNVDIDLATLTNGEIRLMIIAEDTGVGTGTQPDGTLPVTIKIVIVDTGKAEFSITFSSNQAIAPVVGTVLTATEDSPDPEVANAVYSYQWYHVGDTVLSNEDISGATNETYTLKTSDEGKQIGVRVRYDEDSLKNDGKTPAAPTGVETVITELTMAKDIQSDISDGSASALETDGIFILARFDDYTLQRQSSFVAVKADGTSIQLTGIDKNKFKLVQEGTGVVIVSTVGFDYARPTDEDRMNTYVYSLRFFDSSGSRTSSTDYTLSITDDTSDNPQTVSITRQTNAGVHSATGTVTETDNILKITSLKDAIEAFREIKSALDAVSATFASAVVDSDDPRTATITFTVSGQDDLVFTYVLSGDDVTDVILVQNGTDVSVVTVSGLDHENPADSSSPANNIYNFVETITISKLGFPSSVSREYDLTINDDPSEVSIKVYESHPLHKPIDTPFGDLTGYELTAGYGDNAFFTIDTEGKLWWKATPDYETPRDGDGNSRYEIELSNTTSGQSHQADIVVTDIGADIDPNDYSGGLFYVPRMFIRPIDFADDDLPTITKTGIPADFPQYLISGKAWKMPETGPMVITYSISAEDRNELATAVFPNDQSGLDTFYSTLESTLSMFEKVANIDFIEIEHGEEEYATYDGNPNQLVRSPIPHINLFFKSGGGSAASSGDDGARISLDYEDILTTPKQKFIILHEFGHVLGLEHPFDSTKPKHISTFDPDTHWPGNDIYTFSKDSVLSYNRSVVTLQPADIVALQFLYGEPGTNFEGVESLIVDI